MDSDPFLDGGKQRFGFDAWPRRLTTEAESISRGFALDPRALATPWMFIERQVEGNGYCDTVQSSADPSQKAIIQVAEYPNAEDARQALLSDLTYCMAPTLPRLDAQGINLGDVAFGGFDGSFSSLIFIRHNVLANVRSIGKTTISVLDLAKLVDAQIQASANA